jgi:hypothetical protein
VTEDAVTFSMNRYASAFFNGVSFFTHGETLPPSSGLKYAGLAAIQETQTPWTERRYSRAETGISGAEIPPMAKRRNASLSRSPVSRFAFSSEVAAAEESEAHGISEGFQITVSGLNSWEGQLMVMIERGHRSLRRPKTLWQT